MTHLEEIKKEMLEYAKNNPKYSKRALILDMFDNILKSFESRNCLNCDKFGNQTNCIIKQVNGLSNLLIKDLKPSEFSCNSWDELK